MRTPISKLREEIVALRKVGSRMSNICYNIGNHSQKVFDPRDKETMAALVRQWDAIPRSEDKS